MSLPITSTEQPSQLERRAGTKKMRARTSAASSAYFFLDFFASFLCQDKNEGSRQDKPVWQAKTKLTAENHEKLQILVSFLFSLTTRFLNHKFHNFVLCF